MDYLKIACDVLGFEDAALTRKQIDYLKSCIAGLQGIEQRALEDDKFSEYGKKESSLRIRAIQKLKDNKVLYSILALSTLDYSDLLSVTIDFLTGEIADGEEIEIEDVRVIPATDNKANTEAPATSEDETHKCPKLIEDFLDAKVCIHMPTFDHDCGGYVDDDNCPLDTAYSELWKTREKRAVWLEDVSIDILELKACYNKANKKFTNRELFKILTEGTTDIKKPFKHETEKEIKRYLRFWLADWFTYCQHNLG